MARILGFLFLLAIAVYVIAAMWLFALALVVTVAIVKHVRARRRVAPRDAPAAKLHRNPPPVPRLVPRPAAGPAPAYLTRWSVQRRWFVAGDKDDWDKAFRDAELRAQVRAAGPVAYRTWPARHRFGMRPATDSAPSPA